MSARKIPAKEFSIRGRIAGGQAFESLLERDFYVLLEFDPTVAEFYTQEIAIPYTDGDGRERTYYPDALVHFRPDLTSHAVRPSLLAEVKPEAKLKRPTDKLQCQMRAAEEFAASRGWEYRVFTEREIRTPLLENAMFLRQFSRRAPDLSHREMILTRLQEMGRADIETLVTSIYKDKWNQASLIPFVWSMVASRIICAELTAPLTMKSPLWIDARS